MMDVNSETTMNVTPYLLGHDLEDGDIAMAPGWSSSWLNTVARLPAPPLQAANAATAVVQNQQSQQAQAQATTIVALAAHHVETQFEVERAKF